MDEYLDCLYRYVLDHLLLDVRLDLIDYNRRSMRENMAWDALEKSLTPEQLDLVEEYQSACGDMRFLEDELLFQKAIALGKWLAQA